MTAHLDTPTLTRWREILTKHTEPLRPDYRRENERHYIESATVNLSLLEGDPSDIRPGRLLNASSSGLMIKQFDDLPVDTPTRIDLTIGEDSVTLIGRVVHSTQTLGGYKIGIQLEFDQQNGGG